MLEIARKHGHRPDARIKRLEGWIRANMAPDGCWNERRLVLFTEYEDTRRWVEKRLAEALDDLQTDDRIASFTGATPLDEFFCYGLRSSDIGAKNPLAMNFQGLREGGD
jgi:hypothetical protein